MDAITAATGTVPSERSMRGLADRLPGFATRLMALALLVGIASTPGTLMAQTAAPAPIYKTFQERQKLGSMIRNGSTTSPIAVNHTYDQLSAADRAVLFGYFQKMGPGDEPPFPLYGIGPIIRSMFDVDIVGEWQAGDVLVLVEVDADGKGVSAKVSGVGTAETARYFATVAALEKYKPARCAGKPCAGSFPLLVTIGID